jgi:hypothetical protein
VRAKLDRYTSRIHRGRTFKKRKRKNKEGSSHAHNHGGGVRGEGSHLLRTAVPGTPCCESCVGGWLTRLRVSFVCSERRRSAACMRVCRQRKINEAPKSEVSRKNQKKGRGMIRSTSVCAHLPACLFFAAVLAFLFRARGIGLTHHRASLLRSGRGCKVLLSFEFTAAASSPPFVRKKGATKISHPTFGRGFSSAGSLPQS